MARYKIHIGSVTLPLRNFLSLPPDKATLDIICKYKTEEVVILTIILNSRFKKFPFILQI